MRDVTPYAGGMARTAGRGAAGCLTSVAGIITIAVVAYLLISTLVSTFDPIERSHRDAQYYREERLQDDLYNADLAAGYAWRLAPAFGAVVICTSGSFVLVLMFYRRWTSYEMLREEKKILQLAAENQRFPEGLQSLSYHDSRRIETATPALLPEPEWKEADPEELPAFADLMAVGRIGPGQPLCLGLDTDTGEGIWGDWKDLYSAGLGGKQGSGKTWTAASLICQSLLNGARVILADPHSGNDESLTTRLRPVLPFCELAADDDGPILEAARYAHEEFKRRKADDKAGKRYDRTPLLLVIDEWTALLRGPAGDELPELLSSISTEGRKYGVNAMLLAQRWEAAAAGGSDVRNVLNSHYVHRCRGDEGRMQTGMRAGSWSGDPITLHPGEAYLFTAQGDVRKVSTPYMTPADIESVAARLKSGATTEVLTHPTSVATTKTQRIGFHVSKTEVGTEAVTEVGTEAAATVPLRPLSNAVNQWTPEELRIIALLKAGKGPREIVKEVYKVTGGDAYKTAAAKVQAILAKLAALSLEVSR